LAAAVILSMFVSFAMASMQSCWYVVGKNYGSWPLESPIRAAQRVEPKRIDLPGTVP
jgi:hypothetical protein